MSPSNLPPYFLRINQAPTIAHVVAEDDEIWREKSVILWRCGVVEFEAVGSVVEPDVEREGLVEVPKQLKVYGECALVRGNAVTKTSVS